MNILLLGSGGREHALAWKIAASPLADRLICAPGNAGIAREAEIAALDLADHAAIVAFCRADWVDFVVVGPEAPLCAGLVDDLEAAGIKAFYGPFGDFSDPDGCEAQFRNAFLMGCAGAWSLHPSQIAIAKRVFSPDPAEVATARKIIAAMPDGSGAVMIDGKMQDDATWKQAKVVVDLARLVAAKDPDIAASYGF